MRLTKVVLLTLVVIFVFSGLSFLTLAQEKEIEPGAESPIRIGNPNAAIKVEVFYDFQCPSCVSVNRELRRVRIRNGDRVMITVRHFPLPMHDKGMIAAQAVEAACKQGKCFEMIDWMLANQNRWAWTENYRQLIVGEAKRLRMNLRRFKTDLESPDIIERINKDVARARSLEVNSVPTVFLNGNAISYPDAQNLSSVILKR